MTTSIIPTPDPSEVVIVPARVFAKLLAMIETYSDGLDDLSDGGRHLYETVYVALTAQAPVTERWFRAREGVIAALMQTTR